MTASRPTLAFLFRHPAHFVALGFGAGLAPFAPGTFGTLVAFPIAWLLRTYTNDAGFIATIVLLVAAGAWTADITSRHLGSADDGSIVIDEIAAFLLVLFFVGDDWLRQGFAFLLFRLFDIVKPPPAGLIDREWHHGIGVMADDLVAAGYTLLAIALWQRTFG